MEHTQGDRPPYPEQTGVDPLRRTSEIRGCAAGGCPSWRPWPRSGPGYGTNMTDQIVLLVLGFALTTVVGGVLGYYYQRRTWDANRREGERTAAANVFDDISRAMDERLYRMRLVYWGLKQGDDQRIKDAMNESRVSLTKWNDNLNRNLALAYRYFGADVWRFLSNLLYEEFAVIGRHLEDRYR